MVIAAGIESVGGNVGYAVDAVGDGKVVDGDDGGDAVSADPLRGVNGNTFVATERTKKPCCFCIFSFVRLGLLRSEIPFNLQDRPLRSRGIVDEDTSHASEISLVGCDLVELDAIGSEGKWS